MKSLMKNIVLILTMITASSLYAEGGSRGGDEFRKTAQEYQAKAEKYGAKGMPEVAELYGRQAEIKNEAARMGDAGKWDEIDWTEYHENEGKINALLHGQKKYKKKHY